MECRSSSLCIFDKPPVQTDYQKSMTIEYYPISTLQSGGPIEFHIPGNTEDYIDVNDISLYVKFKVLKSDGKAITDKEKVGLINLPIASLFQDVSLTIGETQVEGGQNLYPYLGYIRTVTQFEPSAQASHMQTQGWFLDEAGKFESEKNDGFEKRSKLIDDSKTCELMGPVFLDFFTQDRHLISQTDMRIKLLPSKADFVLNAYSAIGGFKIQFLDVILYVPRIELNPSVINGHAVGLRKQNAFYPITHNEIITFTIPKGQKSYTKDRLFPDQAPKLLILGMVNNEAFNGDILKNPFNFQHFNLSKIALFRDGRCIPSQPFTPDFKNKHFTRSYKHTMRTLDYYNTSHTNGFTPFMFANGYTLYAYDLTADNDIASPTIQAVSSKNLRLELFFDSALTETINVILFASSNSAIEITQLRDVITHYTR